MKKRLLALGTGSLILTSLLIGVGVVQSEPKEVLTEPTIDSKFWKQWGDGQAEVAGYDLTFTRYGQARQGTAITIFVTENFSNKKRVKADAGNPENDTFPVMKLNLIQDFRTGVYDYNMMTSSFVSLAEVNKRGAGLATKVSFSSQEWCGHVYHQMMFDKDAVRYQSHSYFDGEADASGKHKYPDNGIAEDALFHWARGFAAPALKAGETKTISSLRSLEVARLFHTPVEWEKIILSRSAKTEKIKVPAGEFDVETYTAVVGDTIAKQRTWTFKVESVEPHRIVQWSNSLGHKASLLASKRMKYWELNRNGGEKMLEKIGLKARPKRHP
ncbi:MAG: hypothetical protein P1V97_09070 [Planctomycetota bacterium]|nr:hypothetical protein [Planctomycetota bacterium]